MNVTSPQISVIIPVYNVELYLSKCIESVLKQTFTDYELLLINDGSTDNSANICDEYAKKDFRIKIFHKNNSGVSSARNWGLNHAKGKWICFVDSDDWVNPTYLADFFFYPILKNSIVIQGIAYDFCNGKNQIMFSYTNNLYKVKSDENGVVANKLFHNGCPVAKLFDSEIIKINNIRFDESISLNEDHLFVFEYYKYVDNIILSDKINYHYWFDYFAVSLTKKYYEFSQLMSASQAFFEVIPVLIKRYNITNHNYLCSLYTTCGINQMFKALINSYYSSIKTLPFCVRYDRFNNLKKFIKTYYHPEEVSLKLAKYFILNFNISINNIFFYLLAKILHLRKKIARAVKRIVQ